MSRMTDEELAELDTNANTPGYYTIRRNRYAIIRKLIAALKVERSRVAELEAELKAVRGLIPGWKEGDFGLPDYERGKMDGRQECAKELQAVLDKAT